MKRKAFLASLFKNSALAVAGILLLMTAAYPAMVGDFAPLQVGNTWVYSYYYYQWIDPLYSRDSMTITLKIQSKINQGADTMIVINSHQHSLLYNWKSDTVFIDTCIARGDSIIRKNYYENSDRKPIFPFWSTHSIDQDSLNKIKMGNDILFEKKKISFTGDSLRARSSDFLDKEEYYVQNIGLRYLNYVGPWPWESVWPNQKRITLLSFNGNHISVSVKPVSIQAPSLHQKTSYSLMMSLSKARFDATSILFSITGKTISSRQTRMQGIIIEKLKTSNY